MGSSQSIIIMAYRKGSSQSIIFSTNQPATSQSKSKMSKLIDKMNFQCVDLSVIK